MDCIWSKDLKALFRRTADELIIAEKDRSRALTSLAMQAAELGWHDNYIYGLISDADDRWGKYKDRSDCDAQRAGLVEYARRKHPYATGDASFAGLIGADTQVNPQIAFNYAEFMALDVHLEWIFEGLITMLGYGILFGPSGVGKTQFGLQMARAAALGKDFLYWKNVLNVPRRVIFFSLEMGPEDLKFFMEKMDKSLSENDRLVLKEHLTIIPLGEAMPLTNAEARIFFEGLITEKKSELIFIDSLGTMATGSLTEDGPAREMLTYIQHIRKSHRCALYIIHHANKSNLGPELTLTDFYGNTYLFTGTDFVLGLAYVIKEDSTMLKVSLCKMRLSGGIASFDIIRTEFLTFEQVGGDSHDLFRNFVKGESTGSSFGGIEI